VLPEAAQDGISELAIHFDVAFAGKGIVAGNVSGRTPFPGDPTQGKQKVE